MTAHGHEAAAYVAPITAADRSGASAGARRRRWLLPGLIVALVVGALVIGGLLSLSSVLYAGMFGGMLFMHLGGHGHGGHSAAGHTQHVTSVAPDSPRLGESLNEDSAKPQSAPSPSAVSLGERAANETSAQESEGHDDHGGRGCH